MKFKWQMNGPLVAGMSFVFAFLIGFVALIITIVYVEVKKKNEETATNWVEGFCYVESLTTGLETCYHEECDSGDYGSSCTRKPYACWKVRWYVQVMTIEEYNLAGGNYTGAGVNAVIVSDGFSSSSSLPTSLYPEGSVHRCYYNEERQAGAVWSPPEEDDSLEEDYLIAMIVLWCVAACLLMVALVITGLALTLHLLPKLGII